MYDLIIAGAGPAGMTAAIYAVRKRLNVLLVTKNMGGKTNYRLALPWIEEYQVIRGLEVINRFKSELEYLNYLSYMVPVERVYRQGEQFAVTKKGGGELQARAVIIATGTRLQRLHIPGENEFMMRGLCYSAISYAPLFIDRTAIVIGDGERALRSVAELATIAKQTFFVTTDKDRLASPLGGKIRENKKVILLEGSRVTEVKGDEYARCAVIQDQNGQESEIPADGIFIETPLIPNSQIVAGLVELDSQERIRIDLANRTSVPGIFAAGDVTNCYAEQVLVAVGEGSKAALSAYEYLLPTL